MRHSITQATRATTRSRRTLAGATKALLALLFWLAVWYALSALVGKELLLPSPLTVAKKLVQLGATGGFWSGVALSLLRIFCGCALGIIIGALLAALTAVSGVADTLLSPLVRTVRATPVASFIILALLWIGRAFVPTCISALMVAPVVFAATRAAIAETSAPLLEMAGSFRFGKLKTLRLIYIPSVRPAFSAACMTAVGLAWKSGVAAEVLCLPKGAIGTRLYYAKLYLETGELFAWTAVVVILSFLLERLFKLALGGKKA